VDEVELVKSFGDVWDEAGDIIEAMQALGKRIETLHVGEPADESHTDIRRLIHAQVDLVFSTLRVTLARVENGIRPAAANPAPNLEPSREPSPLPSPMPSVPTSPTVQPEQGAGQSSDAPPAEDNDPGEAAADQDQFQEVVAAE
jgi:hypothetical protein